ncbi:hypothetical protein ACFC0D_31575 [Streptomyces sp. NPDC056222]|uniref:hypothetical protein n=1 Tax=Streptomyces sp. NPDC056222 TaxID=3345749 RepID=UPI0035E37A24
MPKYSLRAAALLALVAAVAAPIAVAAPAPAEPAPVNAPLRSSLEGDARMAYAEADEAVRVSVNAHAAFGPAGLPTRSWGTFRISHEIDGIVHWGEFKVDCLSTGGPTATVTGRLVRTSPGHIWGKVLEPNTRMGVSFYVPEKGGEARIGLSGATLKGEPLLTKCMAPAADARVIEGGYTLRDRR